MRSYEIGAAYEVRTAKRRLKCRKCGAIIAKGEQYAVKTYYEHRVWVGRDPRYYVAAFRYPTRSRDLRRQMRLCMKCYEEELRAREEARRKAEERRRRTEEKAVRLAAALLAKGLVLLDEPEYRLRNHPCLEGVEELVRVKDPDLAGIDDWGPLPLCRLRCRPELEIRKEGPLMWSANLPCGGKVFATIGPSGFYTVSYTHLTLPTTERV